MRHLRLGDVIEGGIESRSVLVLWSLRAQFTCSFGLLSGFCLIFIKQKFVS